LRLLQIGAGLRVVDGEYIFVTKGKGRYVLALDFVRQLETKPGLAVLNYRIPSAAITTLELLIPEENLKVDVEPMLAATTSQVKLDPATQRRTRWDIETAKETAPAVLLAPLLLAKQNEGLRKNEAAEADFS